METNKNRMQGLKRALIILPIIIFIMILGEVTYVNYFNRQQHTLTGEKEVEGVSVSIAGKEGTTSTWMKRGYDLYGETVDLIAQTMDVVFVNDSRYQIEEWEMTVNIEDDCLLNQAWCGKVEIHQHVNGDTKVQTLDLRNYSLEEVTLDYLYDGDLLIPLSKGDYVIYYPSSINDEIPVDKKSQMTMGFILYYLEFPTASNYEVTYTFHRRLTDDNSNYLVLMLIIIWLVALMFYVVSTVTYKNTVKEMEIKKSGILSLSDMYSIIYIIDLKDGVLMPVVADEASEKLRPKNMSAEEQLKNMFEYDSIDSYKDMACEFCDLATLEKRMGSRNTLAFEYISNTYGWCRIRFFAMDRVENEPLCKVVFTIQNINDEKAEMEAIVHRVNEAEHESKAKSAFLTNMSHEIRTPINTIIGLNTMIMRESKEPVIRHYAKNVNNASNMLLSLINGILDLSKIEADKMELVMEEYSLGQLVRDVISMVQNRAEFERLEFKYEVAENLPDKLYGDKVRIKQVLLNLINNAAKYTDEGCVKLSIFGKIHDGQVHLLVSVKDTGIGIHEDDLDKLSERFTRLDEKRNHSVEGTGIGLNLVSSILRLMDSELHVLSKYGEGSEFYFEIEQKVVEETPIGRIDHIAENDDMEEYQALFTAPNAKVLVVDDNAMNLNVFVELLKETQLEIDTVRSGAAALEKTARQKYDLIFMDHMMPEMDGVEALHKIRSQQGGQNHKTPVIVLTANAVKGAKEEYCGMGFDDFLAKPIQPDLLERKIMEYLDASKIKENTSSAKKKEGEEVVIPIISGVDVAYGLNHTGGLQSYLSVLRQFVNMADADLKELMSYADAIQNSHEAVNDFRIKIHAMKASANIIGAFRVYGIAAMLESAAMHENVRKILDVTPYFYEEWSDLKNAVEESIPKSKEKHSKPAKETLESIFHLLETSIKSYDIKNVDSIMKELQSFEWNDDEIILMKELEAAVAGLDAEKTVDLCGQLKKILGFLKEE